MTTQQKILNAKADLASNGLDINTMAIEFTNDSRAEVDAEGDLWNGHCWVDNDQLESFYNFIA